MTVNRFRNEQQIIDDLRRRHRRAERCTGDLAAHNLHKPFRSLRVLKRLVAAA